MKESRHIVICPHCGRKALDHMTECPSCHGALTPRGYTPMDGKKMAAVRSTVRLIVMAGAAIALLIHFLGRTA